MRFLASLPLLALGTVATLAPAIARADAPVRDVVVVEAPSELDAAQLRSDVAAELGAEAVAPGDPRAARANGTVRVSVDHAAHTLVVEYRGHAEPIARSVDLPADAEAIERAAVLLAGNLARDEAGELAASLRKPKPVAPPDPPAVESTVPEEVERAELDHLGATLAFDAQWSRSRKTLSNVALGIGLGAMVASAGASIYAAAAHVDWVSDSGFYLLQGGNVFLVGSYLLGPGNFDELGDFYARERAQGLPPALVRDDVERAWARAARRERGQRRLVGWLTIAGGSLVTLLSGAAIAGYARQSSSSSASTVGAWSGLTGLGLFDLVIGIDLAASRGPLESALDTYETSTGRRLARSESARLVPVLAPVPGGGIVGLGGRF